MQVKVTASSLGSLFSPNIVPELTDADWRVRANAITQVERNPSPSFFVVAPRDCRNGAFSDYVRKMSRISKIGFGTSLRFEF